MCRWVISNLNLYFGMRILEGGPLTMGGGNLTMKGYLYFGTFGWWIASLLYTCSSNNLLSGTIITQMEAYLVDSLERLRIALLLIVYSKGESTMAVLVKCILHILLMLLDKDHIISTTKIKHTQVENMLWCNKQVPDMLTMDLLQAPWLTDNHMFHKLRTHISDSKILGMRYTTVPCLMLENTIGMDITHKSHHNIVGMDIRHILLGVGLRLQSTQMLIFIHHVDMIISKLTDHTGVIITIKVVVGFPQLTRMLAEDTTILANLAISSRPWVGEEVGGHLSLIIAGRGCVLFL